MNFILSISLPALGRNQVNSRRETSCKISDSILKEESNNLLEKVKFWLTWNHNWQRLTLGKGFDYVFEEEIRKCGEKKIWK